MSFLFNFFIGFTASFVGVIPPGLLNMSAAKISMKEGRKRALLFSVGVSVTVIVQTYIALVLARYLDKNPDVIDVLQKVALGIFICLTIYFFFIAKDTRRELPATMVKSKTNRFFNGMMIAALNLLPLPYWVYIGVTFAAFGWFSFAQTDLIATVIGSGIGTLIMLGVYVQFFKRNSEKTTKQSRINMNYVIGAITAIIAIITVFKIVKTL